MASKKIQNEPFGLILGDELIHYKKIPPLKLLIDEYKKKQKNIIGVQKVLKSELKNYGIVKMKETKNDETVSKIELAIEKPPANEAPSQYAIIGWYVFNYHFTKLIKQKFSKAKNLTEILQYEIKNFNCYAYKIKNNRYDVGSVKGFVKANEEFFKEEK